MNGGRLNVVKVQTNGNLRFLESLRPSYSSDLKSKFRFRKLQMCDGFRKRIQYRFPDSKSCFDDWDAKTRYAQIYLYVHRSRTRSVCSRHFCVVMTERHLGLK